MTIVDLCFVAEKIQQNLVLNFELVVEGKGRESEKEREREREREGQEVKHTTVHLSTAD